MRRYSQFLVLGLTLVLAATAQRPATGSLEAGFRNPPDEVRPHTYWLWLNGYVNIEEAKAELRAMKAAGFRGVLMFDMGGRGDASKLPPAGPAFLSPPWMKNFREAVNYARELGLQFDFSVISSWDLGGQWVEPKHGSMGIYHSETTIDGGSIDTVLPMPPVPPAAPRTPDGKLAFQKEVAVLAVRNATRRPGHEFVWALDPPGIHTVKEAVLDNGDPRAPANIADTFTPTRSFTIAVSDTGTRDEDFREIIQGELPPGAGAKHFPIPAGTRAKYVRLLLTSAHDATRPHWTLAEFQLFSTDGTNVVQGRTADTRRNGAVLIRNATPLGYEREWTLAGLNNGSTQGARGVFASAGQPAYSLHGPADLVDITSHVDAEGRLRWNAPAGKWTILRYTCLNTGEKLKVPSPNSDGLATDHLNPEATRTYMRYVIDRLHETFGKDLKNSGIRNLYLASYEVVGPIWSPVFVDEFRKRRGYDMKPYLPALFGSRVGSQDQTERFLFDYRKTLGEVLVDAYYGVAREEAHAAGLSVKSEAGGPGPPVHNVPVDSLAAHAAVDSIQGEFWPYWPQADSMWVVKEPASAVHVYGRREVNLESFTSTEHWREGPGDLKPAADRVFVEGGNHFVWHTWTHNAPEAGLPGWVYLAGTHVNRNVTWWPYASAFLDYLSRGSYMLQRGLYVGDLLYYYGDGGYKFVLPPKAHPERPRGYGYDEINSDAILHRLSVKNGQLTLPDGMSYAAMMLPESEQMDPDVLEKLVQLSKQGGVIVGPRPTRAHGMHGDDRVQKLAGQLVLKAVPPLPPDFTAPEAFAFTHRRDGDTDIYFVRNTTDQPAKGRASFRVDGKQPELWDPVTGGIRFAPDKSTVDLDLPPNGSVFVVFRSAKGPVTHLPQMTGTQALEGPWAVDFGKQTVTFPSLVSWTTNPDPNVRYYSGTAKYRKSFTRPSPSATLDLGRLWAIAKVTLNGKPLGILWTPPYRIDLTPALRDGENQLEVEVANTWFNRLIGDAKLPADQRVTRTNTTSSGGQPWAALTPIESGLFGPVRLEWTANPAPASGTRSPKR